VRIPGHPVYKLKNLVLKDLHNFTKRILIAFFYLLDSLFYKFFHSVPPLSGGRLYLRA
jgi:hypothetical protein